MADNLKLIPSDDKVADDSLGDRVKRVDELVDELITANETLKDEMDSIRLALGMDSHDFAKFKRDGFRFTDGVKIAAAIAGVEQKLEKALGRK
jgi:hypothetical protein